MNNIKDKILFILNKNIGKTVSGAEIAKELGITRNSVWKAINTLKKQGFDIVSSPNSGYILNKEVDVFTSDSISVHLKSPHKILIYDEADSSNRIAKELAMSGESEGTIVIVKSQTQGKGRMGRSFISSSENGLYMTIILRPSILARDALSITTLGAVAVSEAIEKTSGETTQIKWVNDIYIGKKKVSGILCEAGLNFESGMLDYAVIGIGINILPPSDGFSPEISEIATSIYEKDAPCGYKSRLCAEIIDMFFDYYAKIEQKDYMKAYKQKSNILGKEIEIDVGGKIASGIAVDIDDDASLIVKTDDGIKSFNSGDARIKRW